jgi:hypothetical protein
MREHDNVRCHVFHLLVIGNEQEAKVVPQIGLI